MSHVGVVVSDLERSVEWLGRALGGAAGPIVDVPEAGARTCHVSLGDATLEIIQGPAPEDASYARPNDEVGGFHVCVAVPDAHAAVEHLGEIGVATSTPPVEMLPNLWACYFRDPEGIQFQLIQQGEARGLHHFAFNVSDLDASLDWYERMFGLRPVMRSQASGEHISGMFEVSASSYEFALLAIGGIQLELMAWGKGTAPSPSKIIEPGAWHIALEVDDIEAVIERARTLAPDDIVVSAGGQSGRGKDQVMFLADPDGFTLQLVRASRAERVDAGSPKPNNAISRLPPHAPRGLEPRTFGSVGPLVASRLSRPFVKGERGDSNPRPPGPQPGALPTELRPPETRPV